LSFESFNLVIHIGDNVKLTSWLLLTLRLHMDSISFKNWKGEI